MYKINNKIYNIVKNVRKIELNRKIESTNSIIIIDFFNIYCNIIKFNKYGLFSKETYIMCMKLIVSTFKNYHKIYIVSKNIFEVNMKEIAALTEKYNITYFIVEDLLPIYKTKNRERDDYVCILLHFLCQSKGNSSYVITNDKFSNIENILEDIKPVNIKVFKDGKENNFELNEKQYARYKAKLLYTKINRIQFLFR